MLYIIYKNSFKVSLIYLTTSIVSIITLWTDTWVRIPCQKRDVRKTTKGDRETHQWSLTWVNKSKIYNYKIWDNIYRYNLYMEDYQTFVMWTFKVNTFKVSRRETSKPGLRTYEAKRFEIRIPLYPFINISKTSYWVLFNIRGIHYRPRVSFLKVILKPVFSRELLAVFFGLVFHWCEVF